MKKAMILLVFMLGALVWAQDQSTITVTKTEVSNGVVIVNLAPPGTAVSLKASAKKPAQASFHLQCNQDASGCQAPAPGSYLMVRLPKNWGMYDCANVDLYPAGADPASSQKIGEYCLIEK